MDFAWSWGLLACGHKLWRTKLRAPNSSQNASNSVLGPSAQDNLSLSSFLPPDPIYTRTKSTIGNVKIYQRSASQHLLKVIRAQGIMSSLRGFLFSQSLDKDAHLLFKLLAGKIPIIMINFGLWPCVARMLIVHRIQFQCHGLNHNCARIGTPRERSEVAHYWSKWNQLS